MSAEIIDIKLGNNSPPSSPKLSVVGNGDEGLIKLNNLPPLDIGSTTSEKKSVNFGPGADLLINQKVASKSNSPKSDINLSELQSLAPGSNSSKKTAHEGGGGNIFGPGWVASAKHILTAFYSARIS